LFGLHQTFASRSAPVTTSSITVPTVSCTLPPKAQISYTATISQEDNGL